MDQKYIPWLIAVFGLLISVMVILNMIRAIDAMWEMWWILLFVLYFPIGILQIIIQMMPALEISSTYPFGSINGFIFPVLLYCVGGPIYHYFLVRWLVNWVVRRGKRVDR